MSGRSPADLVEITSQTTIVAVNAETDLLARWPVEYLFRGQHLDLNDEARWGPDANAECPCGSRSRARSCHDPRETGWTLPSAGPLLMGERTAFSHPRCYASITQDCSKTISSEHWLSADVMREIDEVQVRFTGAPWQCGEEMTLPIANMGANILCTRHNTALSPLDRTAGNFFRILREFDRALRSNGQSSLFALLDGHLLERWFLKLLWGGVESRNLQRQQGEPYQGIRADADKAILADYLFRAGRLPENWGMVSLGRRGAAKRIDAALSIDVIAGAVDDTAWACEVTFGYIPLGFTLAEAMPPSDADFVYRPHAVIIENPGHTRQMCAALSWRSPGPRQYACYVEGMSDDTEDRGDIAITL